VRNEFSDSVKLLSEGMQLHMPLSRNLAGIHPGLHELRFKDRAGVYRVFYYIRTRDAIYMLHAFKKKTQEIPEKEKTIVLRRIREVN